MKHDPINSNNYENEIIKLVKVEKVDSMIKSSCINTKLGESPGLEAHLIENKFYNTVQSPNFSNLFNPYTYHGQKLCFK